MKTKRTIDDIFAELDDAVSRKPRVESVNADDNANSEPELQVTVARDRQ